MNFEEFRMILPVIIAGALGGTMKHLYWLIAIGHEAKGQSISSSKKNSNFRLSLLVFSALAGAVAGLLVSLWLFSDLQTNNMSKEKIYALGAIAGLSFELFLQFKMPKLNG